MRNVKVNLSSLVIVGFSCIIVGMVIATPSIADSLFALNDLTDVDTTGVLNGQVIKFNFTSNKWEPENDIVGSGGGVIYNQDLNTTDSPSFLDITLTNFPFLDKNSSNDFSGSWNALTNIPSGFADNVDNTSSINQSWIDNWNESYSWGDHSGLYAQILHWHNGSYYSKTILNPWISNWNKSYSWGNHSNQNYLDLDTYPNTDTDSTNDFSGNYNNLTNKPTNYSDDDLSDNNTDDLLEGLTNFWCTLTKIQSLLSGQWLNLNNITLGSKTITDSNISYWDSISSGATYNQSLNTTDGVVFANLTTPNYYISNATLIPKWNMYVDVNGTLVWEMIP